MIGDGARLLVQTPQPEGFIDLDPFYSSSHESWRFDLRTGRREFIREP